MALHGKSAVICMLMGWKTLHRCTLAVTPGINLLKRVGSIVSAGSGVIVIALMTSCRRTWSYCLAWTALLFSEVIRSNII